LKPQNVLIDEADQPRITDFGLAKLLKDDSRLTQTGVVMGSPSYMPPEQAAGRLADVGPASDVYSLGAILYELLTGQPPFRAETALDTMLQVLERDPTPPRRLKAGIPADLETICLKCLEKAPSTRYPTARALAEELDRFLKGEPIQTRPASPIRWVVSWVRRHPGTLAALAAFVVVALSLGVYYLFEQNAFLRAQQVDPLLKRVPGLFYESSDLWGSIYVLAAFVGWWTSNFLTARAKGLSIKALFRWTQAARPLIHPLGEGARTVALCLGLALIGCGVVLLAKAIQANVWEGISIWIAIVFPYLPINFGLSILGQLIGDYRRALYGTPSMPSRQLAAKQMEPIRHAIERFDVADAMYHYRNAVPDAGPEEARQYVLRLVESQHPERLVPPSMSLVRLNGKAMLICGVIEAVLFVLVWADLRSGWAAAELACGLLFGVGLLAGGDVKDPWKRMRLLVPGIVATIATEVIVSIWAGPTSRSLAAYMLGFFFGCLLMISGFSWRPAQSISKE
jgi:hypothetical protein